MFSCQQNGWYINNKLKLILKIWETKYLIQFWWNKTIHLQTIEIKIEFMLKVNKLKDYMLVNGLLTTSSKLAHFWLGGLPAPQTIYLVPPKQILFPILFIKWRERKNSKKQ